MKTIHCLIALVLGMAAVHGPAAALPKLRVSANQRFLVTESGQPFFWLGDTAWELFHRLNREQVERYLDHRARNGFNVVQAVAISELDGHQAPNPYGHVPLVDEDPARPEVRDGPDNDYWDHVDFIVEAANRRGIYVGFLPTWGRYWHDNVRDGRPIFNPANAEAYGLWLGRRYRDKGIVWILGGDRPADSESQKETIRAMARGLRQGDGGAHLITWHPPGANGSSTWFHNEEWLDFNMRQNGHATEFTGHYDQTRVDYDRLPVKPVIDGEPLYEDHPIAFDARKYGHSIAADVRRPLYWDLFSGAFGHTYGHHSVWQMWSSDRHPINNPLMPWTEAIYQPGATQMQHAKHLMLSRPFLTRVPDDTLVVTDRVATSVPGAGRYRFVGTRDTAGAYAMVYAPVGRKFTVRMDRLAGDRIKAWWFNPRDGKATLIGEFSPAREREFMPLDNGEALDWVLVLDDAARDFAPPGSPSFP
jgi:hypothetical protein